jgi:hypothetical protein
MQRAAPANAQQIMDGVVIDRIKRGAIDENLIDVVVNMRAPPTPAPVPAPAWAAPERIS